MTDNIQPTQPEFIYTIFDNFLKRTLIDKKSFITKEDNDIFSIENIQKIEEKFIKNFDGTKDMSFKDKVKRQFDQSDEDEHCKHIFTNLLYLRYLPIWGVKADAKEEKINPFGLKLADNPFNIDNVNKNNVNKYYPCEAISSYSYSLRAIYEEMVELIFLFDYLFGLLSSDELKSDAEEIKGKIESWVFNSGNCKTGFYANAIEKLKSDESVNLIKQIGDGSSILAADHMLLNLCYPEKYSRIATMSTKSKIVKALYKKYYSEKGYTETLDDCLKFDKIDTIIKTIAENMVKEKNKEIFAGKMLTDIFWDKDCRLEWQGGYVANAYEILTKYQKQVILYGAPGTGKTYSAEQIIKEFIYDSGSIVNLKDDELANYKYNDNYDWTNEDTSKMLKLNGSCENKKVIWEMVQFNQSYSYEDFIEGMRPIAGGALKKVDGIFKRFCNVAKNYSSEDKKTFIFVIDEINRGKIDKIFGELLYLLEYRDKELRLHYSNDKFSIPENVYIIGTMNTADKSIALLDVALRRRFWFVRCEPNRDVLFEEFGIDKNDKLEIINEDKSENIKKLAVKLFDWLNKQLDSLGSDADELKIGHSYFLKLKSNEEDQDITFSDLKNIWFYSIVPLIEEYCGFDKTRVENLLTKGGKKLSKKEDFTLDNLKGKWN